MRPPRYVSLFSGVEAATLAWGPLGWEPMAFCEVDPFPCAVLASRYPDIPNLGDVREVDWGGFIADRGRPDVVVGGSPCQSFSVAGARTGLDGASGLMWEYVRAVRELMPRVLVWENVPGALSSTHGEDFRCLLSSLDELGYGLAWRVLDAQFFGVAQRRRRVFLVGVLGDPAGACEVLFERACVPWDPRPGREKRKELAARAGGRAEAAGGALNAGDPQSKRVYDPGGPSPTLNSGSGEGMNIQPSVLVGEPIPVNTMVATRCNRPGRGTGFGVGDAGDAAYTVTAAHGHAVCIQGDIARGARMGQNGNGVTDDGSAYTLNTIDVPAVVCMADTQVNAMVDGEVCGALTAHAAKDAPVAALTQYGDVAGTLAARRDSSPCADRGQNVVAMNCGAMGAEDGLSGTLQAKSSGGYSLNYINPVMSGSVVRRLTPRECERLQGMPDDWTRVPYRGKPADVCPDGPRYKAIGNSMAVPVMRWIGERAAAVLLLGGEAE